MGITATLNDLEFLMATVHPPAFLALSDGLPLNVIQRTVNAYTPVLEKAGVDFPAELVELFHWHNGSNQEDVIGPVQLLSLEESLETWRALLEAIGTEFTVENWYYPSWIPFAKSWTNSFLCFDAVGVAGGERGQIVDFDREHPTRSVQSLSLEDWLETVVDDYTLEGNVRMDGVAAGDEGEDGLYDYDPDEAPEGPNCHVRDFTAGE
ncbi:SMI1/KNR4 family protein [Corynebacterium urinipleomorphum]|uniref:SMI1/KNR4 family protein n=1 Tax=Corynebacterium urinipleomorphum TaxID=1852380 RepID=UPI000B35F6E9|nr:SMI1/KNR4 family protein [Corynebacterium urinipleomorphum]